ncbi:MAG: hypothetical protein KKD97_16060 [Gammaproteobacteria bacterium]|nr:hypothetical protein [Gammaproteobacteria bacterium]
MREYARFAPAFWLSKICKDIRRAGVEGVVMAGYLKTAPLSNMLGLYPLSLPAAGHETGLGFEGASKGLQICIKAGLCDYDEDSEFVWVFDMAREQIGEALKVSDNQVKNVQKQYAAMEENPFLARFYDRYGMDFHLTEKRGATPPLASPFEGSANTLGSKAQAKAQASAQEQANANGQEQAHAQAGLRPASAKPRAPADKSADEQRSPSSLVWDFYAAAYGTRYGHEPTRNAKVNGQLANFIKRVPVEEAPSIAAFFVTMNSAFYVRKCHAVDCLLADAEAIRTQWLNGRVVTNTHAAQADRTQTNDNAFNRLLKQSEAAHGGLGMDDDDGVLDVEARVVRS